MKGWVHIMQRGNKKLYFAPLEGITGYVYRNAFHKAFNPKIDKYFSPFISPGVNQPLTPKELRDIHPDNNKGIYLVPQILANNPDDFLLALSYIKDLGYDEVNLNLGCPSGTVVAKRKGAGLLGDTCFLEKMLDKIYSTTDVRVSLKTRIGKDSPDEFPELLEIFNKFPVSELIIHPRIRSDFYKNTPNMDSFRLAVAESKAPLSYNGDVNTLERYNEIVNEFENIDSVMIGRGFLKNPYLSKDIEKGEKVKIDIKNIKLFHDILLEEYINIMSGDRPVLFKMKEIWTYMIGIFPDSEKLAKKIRKAEKLSQYRNVVEEMFY